MIKTAQITKTEQLEQLYKLYQACQACPLGTQGRSKIVFGEGNTDSRLMLIGEGPGQQEDEQGKPFVGRSGKLLTKALELVGIKRENIFITNIVKCRPPNNRKPLETEINTCMHLLLLKQIEIIDPKVICTLGISALEGLIKQKIKMSQMRGKPIQFGKTIIFPTYHPAYILRSMGKFLTFETDLKTAYLLATK